MLIGVSMKSSALFRSLQGIPVKDHELLDCEPCRAAAKKDGSCSQCGTGFNKGKRYGSYVAHTLSKGKKGPTDKSCSDCEDYYETLRDLAETLRSLGSSVKVSRKSTRHCSSCKEGSINGFVFSGKAKYKLAGEAFKTLQAAVKRSKECESCAIAMVTDGECTDCNVRFKRGKKVKG